MWGLATEATRHKSRDGEDLFCRWQLWWACPSLWCSSCCHYQGLSLSFSLPPHSVIGYPHNTSDSEGIIIMVHCMKTLILKSRAPKKQRAWHGRIKGQPNKALSSDSFPQIVWVAAGKHRLHSMGNGSCHFSINFDDINQRKEAAVWGIPRECASSSGPQKTNFTVQIKITFLRILVFVSLLNFGFS